MTANATLANLPSRALRHDAAKADRQIAHWLLAVAALVFCMVVLGGVTRLTESGLSIVEWQPLIGAIPPLSEADWQALFAKYQATPEYQKVNLGMTLEGFKEIFWLEYLHRLLGRAIGVAFLLPFLYFLVRRRIRRGLAPQLAVMFVLGALQGALGWYMVQSGLVDRPDVSQYRLAAHLGLAVVLYGLILWTAWGMGAARGRAGTAGPIGAVTLGLLFLTILAGAFVAGIDAGRDYNTWPLMDGRFIPAAYGALEPWWRNLFENIPSVQFNHRWLAALVALHVLLMWRRTEKADARTQLAGRLALGAVGIQFMLGIATLLTAVPVILGALHQAGAMALFTAVLWANHRIRVAD